MNKSELTQKVAEKSGLSLKEAEAAIHTTFSTISTALAAKEKVQIIGFGTFETRERSERAGRNPKTGEQITILGGTVPAFKAGEKLKSAVKGE